MLYIEFEDRPSLESFELWDGIVIDLDADEHVVGIEIEWASKKFDVEELRGRPRRHAGRPARLTRAEPLTPTLSRKGRGAGGRVAPHWGSGR